MTASSIAEAAIIGAGPIGIELAVAFKKAGIEYLHFDARQIAHTISWFAPQTRFFSSNERIAIAGVPLFMPDQTKCTREQYLAYLRSVVVQFDLKINTYEPVLNLIRAGGAFSIRTSLGEYRARRIILATGGTERPRRLGIEGEDLPHVSHYFRDPHDFFRKRLLIIGGRNSAVEAALRSHYCAKVSLSYRREKLDEKTIKYWLTPEMNGLVGAKAIEAHFSTRAVRITSSHVTLQRTDGTTIDVPADFVLALIGYEADTSLCKMAGVELIGAGQTPKFDEATMETNVKGVFVAGTAIGGTQEKYSVFIENCHLHVARILAAITGIKATEPKVEFERPES